MSSATVSILRVVLAAEFGEFGNAGHGAVVVHDLADDAGGNEPGETGEIDGGFGLSGANEDSAFAGAQRKGVAGTREIVTGAWRDRWRP